MGIAHKDNLPQFAEYAYATMTLQPRVPRRFQEVMKRPDAEL